MGDPQTFETQLGEALARYADRAPQAVDARRLVAAITALPAQAVRRWSLPFVRPSLGWVVLLLLIALSIVGTAIGMASQILRRDSQLVVAPSASIPLPSAAIRASAAVVPVGRMINPRAGFTTALLADGRVLVVGGDSKAATRSAELLDPTTGQFTLAGEEPVIRDRPLAIPLAEDRVLVVGGQNESSAEIFDPQIGRFTATGSMHASRSVWSGSTTFSDEMRAVGVLLKDGRVFVTGGAVADSIMVGGDATGEVFDPGSGDFTPTPSIPCDPSRAALARLPDGRVFISCQSPDPPHDEGLAVLFDPATNQYSVIGSVRATTGAATLLPDGRVLLTGGPRGGGSGLLYDPSTLAFTNLPGSAAAIPDEPAVGLPDGRVLYIGLAGNASSIFDPATSGFATIDLGVVPEGAPTVLRDGRALIIDDSGTAWILDPRAAPSATQEPPARLP